MTKREAKKEAYWLLYHAVDNIRQGENIVDDKVDAALVELGEQFYRKASKISMRDYANRPTHTKHSTEL